MGVLMDKILLNNEIMNRNAMIDIEDRAYQFGDGVYEVIGIYDSVPFMLDEHLARLERSAKEIQLPLPFSIVTFKNQLLELAETNGVHEGIIYLQVSRGIASREHAFPESDVPTVTIAYTREEAPLTETEDKGATAVLTEDIRWLRCDIKTLNLLPNVLAKEKAVANGAIEAILHRGDVVTEASASNVFIVKDGQLYTHPANNYILNGITRRRILDLCAQMGITVHEENYRVDDLLVADEVFISATKLDIIPILKVDEHVIGEGNPGEYTKRILKAYRSNIMEHVVS